MPRIRELYTLPIGSKAYPNSNISSSAYNNLLEDLAFDNNCPRPISAGGTGANNAVQACINLGIDNASNLTKGKIIETLLPFLPVQQGGGEGQLNNKIYLGWNGMQLMLQVDLTSMGEVWTSKLAPIALQSLAEHAKKPDHIVYTSDSNEYSSIPFHSFIKELLSCKDDEILHKIIFKNGAKFYKGSQKIAEFMDDGDIMNCNRQKTVWQGIDIAQYTANDAIEKAEQRYIKKTTVLNMMRGPGYIYFDTDNGAVGCSFFLSDERLKKIHGKSSFSVLESIEKFKFIDFNYLPESGMDPSLRYNVGFSANNLKDINELFVETIGDYITPNPTVIIPYLAKALQELLQEVKQNYVILLINKMNCIKSYLNKFYGSNSFYEI
ncbi:tail fiber domain-containing protein [Candidatus Liberibacter brunswickensis]|uniref:tail fiber domain-containing protein n=1 Tax=Candidatus Liberibacter brunswickensis TaxID=1968796 RepID=UPI002FE3C17D